MKSFSLSGLLASGLLGLIIATPGMASATSPCPNSCFEAVAQSGTQSCQAFDVGCLCEDGEAHSRIEGCVMAQCPSKKPEADQLASQLCGHAVAQVEVADDTALFTRSGDCLEDCFYGPIPSTGCKGPADVKCLCKNGPYQQKVRSCVVSRCPERLGEAEQIRSDNCGS